MKVVDMASSLGQDVHGMQEVELMSAGELAFFLTVVAVVVGIWATILFLLPLNGRVTFQYRAAVLRDRCIDAVFDGRLPRTASVAWFIERADAMVVHPERFGIARAFAVHLAVRELGHEPPPTDVEYLYLKPEHRDLMVELDDELNRALAQRFVRGSSFGWLLWLITRRDDDGPRDDQGSVHVPPPEHLAQEDFEMSTKIPVMSKGTVESRRLVA